MRLELSPKSRVLIDLRAAGLLQAVGHSPTLSAFPGPFAVDVADPSAIDCAVDVRVAASSIETPAQLSASDRAKMRDNLLGPEVLDAARYPNIDFSGGYVGTLQAGTLSGELLLRGGARRIAVDVTFEPSGEDLLARGAWVGRLTELGIKPFKALLGALRLEDWIRFRLDVSFAHR